MSTKSKAAAAEEKKPITLSSEHVPLSYRIKKDLQRNGMIYAMLIPVLVYYAIFKFGPMFGLYISFIDYKPARGIFGSKFVGLKWFQSFFSDYYFGRQHRAHCGGGSADLPAACHSGAAYQRAEKQEILQDSADASVCAALYLHSCYLRYRYHADELHRCHYRGAAQLFRHQRAGAAK